MSLTGTSSPYGVLYQDALYLEGGPSVYFMDYGGSYAYSPDSDGLYWGLSGSAQYPVFTLGCVSDFHLKDDVSGSVIPCGDLGGVAAVQSRRSVVAEFSLNTMFSLTTLRRVLNGSQSVVNTSDKAEKFGFGPIRNQQFWKAYFYNVLSQDDETFIAFTMHKAQFVDAWDWPMAYGEGHKIGVKLRAVYDTSLPYGQRLLT